MYEDKNDNMFLPRHTKQTETIQVLKCLKKFFFVKFEFCGNSSVTQLDV